MKPEGLKISETQLRALEYVRNTGGGAELDHFIEDHEPIGEFLWNELKMLGLVTVESDNSIGLTAAGKSIL